MKMLYFHAIGWSLAALGWVWMGKRGDLCMDTKKPHEINHNRSNGRKLRNSDPKARNPGKSRFPIPVEIKIFSRRF
jgi:hypothetical protein